MENTCSARKGSSLATKTLNSSVLNAEDVPHPAERGVRSSLRLTGYQGIREYNLYILPIQSSPMFPTTPSKKGQPATAANLPMQVTPLSPSLPRLLVLPNRPGRNHPAPPSPTCNPNYLQLKMDKCLYV